MFKPMEIVLATVDDIPQLLPLLDILFSQEGEFQPDHTVQRQGLEMIIRGDDLGDVFVAKHTGSVVGMVTLLYTVSTALGGKVALLEDMIVSPEFRDSGVGRAMLGHAQKHAGNVGCKRITLLSDSDNIHAHRFYERYGFRCSTMQPFRKLLVGKDNE